MKFVFVNKEKDIILGYNKMIVYIVIIMYYYYIFFKNYMKIVI